MEFVSLREAVFEANAALGSSGLVLLTWGNVSAVDREHDLFAIKPSGIAYDELTPEDIVVLSLSAGRVVAGEKNPSSDTPTHRTLYLAFPDIGGIAHTHSTYATAWAQACREIPALGTTHADSFRGAIPITRMLTQAEIDGNYEGATGAAIAAHFEESGANPIHTPGVLLPFHGPFTWGKSAAEALQHAIVLEEVARIAYLTRMIAPEGEEVPPALARKHFERKHGSSAYYGQRG